MNQPDNSNKIAIVTGGGDGIGRAVCLQLAISGAKIVIVDINEKKGIEIEGLIKEKGGEAFFIKSDVSEEKDIKYYVESTIGKYNKIDIFINNAGWEGVVSPLVDYPVEIFDKVMNINARSIFLGMKYVLPHMIRRKSGVIVNTASVAGLRATSNLIAYGASKHAVIGMTKTAGMEVAPYGIRVNAVCPGAVQTSMMRSLEMGFANGNDEEVHLKREVFEKATPDGRYAEPQEIANLIFFFLPSSLHNIY